MLALFLSEVTLKGCQSLSQTRTDQLTGPVITEINSTATGNSV